MTLYSTQVVRVYHSKEYLPSIVSVYVPDNAKQFTDEEGNYYQVTGEAVFPSTTAVTYDYRFDGKIKTQYVHRNGTYALIGCDVNNEGYVFEGWCEDPDCKIKSKPEIWTSETAYIFYAKWTLQTT